jgi:hypothetical protein
MFVEQYECTWRATQTSQDATEAQVFFQTVDRESEKAHAPNGSLAKGVRFTIVVKFIACSRIRMLDLGLTGSGQTV